MSKAKAAVAAASLAAILGGVTMYGDGYDFIKHYEGVKLKPYVDVAGVKTICAGHTGYGVNRQVATQELCNELMHVDLANAHAAIERHVTVALPQSRGMALLSFVFNLGETQFRKSTLLKKLNAGNTRAACDELMRWIYAGGKVRHGLVLRRADERALCLINS
ncbi:MAG: lysozyme [Alphaproteobacteria bacterium]|nr:lysozyme [Alphaproteobacteria bacterium]